MSTTAIPKPSTRLRPLPTTDLPVALALTDAQHWSHRIPDWPLHLALGRGFGACEVDGTLVGTALWWDYGGDCATVGLVVVRPDCQGRGIGRQLLQAVLAAAGDRRVGLVAALERRGLRVVDRVTAMRRGAAPATDPSVQVFGLASQALG